MTELQPQFLVVGRGDAARRIAYAQQPGNKPGLVWLQGFKSEMISLKATALAKWAAEHDLAYLRFDYSGHGMSEGRFEDATIGHWLEEASAVFERLTHGPQILIGSSMGGYISLLLLRTLLAVAPQVAARIEQLVLIAPAWDMTHELMWKRFPDDVRREIRERGFWLRPSQYGDGYPITRKLIEDGANRLIGQAPWSPGRPIHVIHGRLDRDVPYRHSQRLGEILRGSPYAITEIADGEHRLSRPQDLAVLFDVVTQAVETCA